MDKFLFVLLILAGLAIGVGLWILGVWIVVWNVNDIAAVGANFWNVFWIMLVASFLFGGTSRAVSK